MRMVWKVTFARFAFKWKNQQDWGETAKRSFFIDSITKFALCMTISLFSFIPILKDFLKVSGTGTYTAITNIWTMNEKI